MEPSVSIHHFVHPAWFEALGGWTKEENIELYVNFAVEAFKRFGKHAKLWSSFNEPTVRAPMQDPISMLVIKVHADMHDDITKHRFIFTQTCFAANAITHADAYADAHAHDDADACAHRHAVGPQQCLPLYCCIRAKHKCGRPTAIVSKAACMNRLYKTLFNVRAVCLQEVVFTSVSLHCCDWFATAQSSLSEIYLMLSLLR